MNEITIRNLSSEIDNLKKLVQQLLVNTNKDEELQYGQPNRINAYFGFPGIIIPYYPESGDLTDLPDNWHECDGTSGTPDMRGQTAIGANGTYAFGTAYGATTVTPSAHAGAAVSTHKYAGASSTSLPHSGTAVAAHSSHQHTMGETDQTVQSGTGVAVVGAIDGNTGSGGPTTHSVTQPDTHTVPTPDDHTVTQPNDHAALSTIQPSRALYWIMRLS